MSGARIPAASPETHKTGAQAPLIDRNIPASFEGKLTVQGQASAPAKIPVLIQQPIPGKAIESPGEQVIAASELFKETASAMGFPKDQVSVALLAFARFFSLSPALLGSLRRDFLALFKDSYKAGLEAGALAVAAAMDKGVTLSPDALAYYARFLIPPDTPFGQKTGEEGFSTAAGEGDDKDNEDEELPEGEKLQAIAEDEAKKDGLLDILNSLPGKNGQYWTVFPLTVKVKGIELRVFIRILKRVSLSPGEGGFVIADISGPRRQWRCFLKEKAGKITADLRVYPEVSAKTLNFLQREAERFLKEGRDRALFFGGFGEILVGNKNESWLEDLCAESLLSINKEV